MALLPLIRQAMLSLCRLLTIPLLASLLTLALLTLLASAPLSASNHIIYVDADSLCNSGCGGSWATAHPYLQDALAEAQSGDEIWVAEGLYYPDEGAGQTANDRASTFQLQNGVAVYGGFAGGEAARDERDWETNVTVLSGDIDGNDITDGGVVTDTANIAGDNAYHVVTGSGTDGTAVLDGFTVTAGQANGSSPAISGGGMFNNGGSPSVANLTFEGNYAAIRGGGMFNESGSSPTLSNVTFRNNTSDTWAGGVLNWGGNPTFTDVTFSGNRAGGDGAGMMNIGSSPALTNVTFRGNSAGGGGGGMHNLSNSNPTLTNVTFVGNQTDTSGGGIYNQSSSPVLTNVIFSGNSAVEDGGGMYGNNYSSSTLTGVTFSGNRAQSEGGAIYNEFNSDTTIQNSILWNNQDGSGTGTANSSLVNVTSTPVIRYSLVQGCNPGGAWTSGCGTDAGNNLADVDPLLVTAVNPASAPTMAGNLRLQAISPAVNVGDNTLIPSGVTTDLDGNARIQQGTVDLGAYEVHPLFVDHTATGAATGVSWTDAFTTVQDALAIAQSGDEIWVATGVYTPGTARTNSFVLQYQLAIYGGFAGTETTLEQRDWETNVTVLSGDVDGNDIVDADGVVTDTANIQGNNTYHVVTADANNGMPPLPTTNYGTAILDGFTITGGSADGSGANASGGGFYNFIAFPTLRNITFQGNQAVNGGGMLIYNSGPALTNVIFRNNSVTGYGGGIFATSPSANVATTLINVLFEGNSALQGGGMAIANTEGPLLINVTFANNDALQGGGLYNANSLIANSATLHNSILWGNTASSGGNQIYNQSANPTLHYTLFANGGNDVSGSPNNPASSNNLNRDPLFVDPAGSDFRLSAISPAVNAGDNAQIPGDVTTDLAGNARIQQGTVDMGAFEVQPGDYQSVCRSGLAQGGTYIFASTGVTATVDTLGSLSELCVTLSQSNHPDAPNGLQSGLYWTITRTASSEDWSLTLSALITDTLDASDRLCRYTGVIWDCGNADDHSIDGDRIIRSGVTQLSDWAIGSLAPTAATVDGFTAERLPDRVRLHWTTLNEVGLTGFHLYRGADPAGPGERITAAPLPGQGGGGLEGFAYAYEDFTPRPAEGAVFYWLEELHTDSAPIRHGPQRIAAEGLRVFLPVVER
jgi:predicted outer membrane repeat protein